MLVLWCRSKHNRWKRRKYRPCGSDIVVRQQRMSRTKKLAIAVASVVLLGAGLLFIAHLRWKAAQARRDAQYSKVLGAYQQNLRPGMTRANVADYLRSHEVSYAPIFWGGKAWAYAIRIGENPSSTWYCEKWTVYVGLEFDSASADNPEIEPLTNDTLREVHL